MPTRVVVESAGRDVQPLPFVITRARVPFAVVRRVRLHRALPPTRGRHESVLRADLIDHPPIEIGIENDHPTIGDRLHQQRIHLAPRRRIGHHLN